MSKTKAEQHAAVEVVAEPHFEGNGRGYGVPPLGVIYAPDATAGGAVTDCGGACVGPGSGVVAMDGLNAHLDRLGREEQATRDAARAKMLRRTRQELRDALVSARTLCLFMVNDKQGSGTALAQLGMELSTAMDALLTLEADAP